METHTRYFIQSQILKDLCIFYMLQLNLKNSQIKNLKNLKKVYGSISLGNKITSTGNLKYLGANLYLNSTQLKSIDTELIIDGVLSVDECVLEDFGKLKKVKKLYINTKKLKSVGDLETYKKIVFGKNCSERVYDLFKNNFQASQTKFIRKEVKLVQEEGC